MKGPSEKIDFGVATVVPGWWRAPGFWLRIENTADGRFLVHRLPTFGRFRAAELVAHEARLVSRVLGYSKTYKPTTATAFSRNSDPSRIYLRTVFNDRWPVWFMIDRSEAPPIAADVANPLLRLCPAKPLAFSPSRSKVTPDLERQASLPATEQPSSVAEGIGCRPAPNKAEMIYVTQPLSGNQPKKFCLDCAIESFNLDNPPSRFGQIRSTFQHDGNSVP